MLYDWSSERIYGVLTFLGATIISAKKNILGELLVIQTDTFTADILNTVIKGIINSIFAILVAVIIHYIKKKGGLGRVIQSFINRLKK